MVGKFRKSQRPLLQILCYIFYIFNELWVGKNCRIPGKLVIEPLCSFNKLTGSDGSLYEHDRWEYHKSMTIEVRW